MTVAAAAVGLLAACEQPTSPDERLPFAAAADPSFLGGQVEVCKEGPAGTYNFSISNVSANVVLPLGNSFTLVQDECKVIATALASNLFLTVEETSTPASDVEFFNAQVFTVEGGVTSGPVNSGNPVVVGPWGDAGKVVIFENQQIVDEGCTLTQGYWKTHADPDNTRKYDDTWDDVGGPDALFENSNLSYIDILKTAPKGDAWFILAHQYIAAILNDNAGADTSDVTDELDDALDLLTTWAPGDLGPKATGAAADARDEALDLAKALDDFNNGVTGPGHCEDDVPPDVSD